MSTYIDSAVRMEGETWKNIAVINSSFNEPPIPRRYVRVVPPRDTRQASEIRFEGKFLS